MPPARPTTAPSSAPRWTRSAPPWGRAAREGTPRKSIADKAYSSCANRAYRHRRGITAVIHERDHQREYRRRRGHKGGQRCAFVTTSPTAASTAGERSFNRFKHWCGPPAATRTPRLRRRVPSGQHPAALGRRACRAKRQELIDFTSTGRRVPAPALGASTTVTCGCSTE